MPRSSPIFVPIRPDAPIYIDMRIGLYAIERTMSCVFVDAKGELISDDCKVIRIDKAETTCKTATRLPEGVRVRFSATRARAR